MAAAQFGDSGGGGGIQGGTLAAERIVEIEEIKVAARCSGAITSDSGRHSPSSTVRSESREGK